MRRRAHVDFQLFSQKSSGIPVNQMSHIVDVLYGVNCVLIIACNCSAVQRISAFLRPCFRLKKFFMSEVFMSKMWILFTYKNCSNESENSPDCIDFGLFFKKLPGGGHAPDPPRLRIFYADAHVASALPTLH